MECPSCVKWGFVPVGLALAANFWTGCGKSDLSGYRRVNSHETIVAKNESDPGTKPVQQEDPLTTSSSDPNSPAEENPSVAQADSKSAELLPASAMAPVNVVDGANVRSVLAVPAVESRTASVPDASKPNASDKMNSASEPHKIELLVKDKTFRTEPKTGALRVSFDDLDLLKILNMEPVVENAPELMPDWLQKLNGKLIRIRGFMYPTYDTEGIEHFVLARDNQICCFGRDPKIYDLIQIDMKPGKTTNYIPATRAFDVVGRFRIDMQIEDGKPFGLYVIDQADVIDR